MTAMTSTRGGDSTTSWRERGTTRGVDMKREGHQVHRFINQLAQERGSRREERDAIAIDAMQLKICNNQPNMMTTTSTRTAVAAIMPR